MGFIVAFKSFLIFLSLSICILASVFILFDTFRFWKQRESSIGMLYDVMWLGVSLSIFMLILTFVLFDFYLKMM